MKTLLKYIIILLLLTAVLAIAFMALSPKQLAFEKATTINAPSKLVYNIVNDLKKWEKWSPVSAIDPEAEFSYTAKTKGVGAKWSWKGNKDLGEGSQTIVEAVPNERLKTAMEGWNGEAYGSWTFQEKNDKTEVSWAFEGPETSFIFRPFNYLMKKSLQKSYVSGLESIKEMAEQRSQDKVYNGYKINETYIGNKHYIMNRQEVAMDKIQQFYTQNLSALFMKAQGEELEMDGMPSALFFNWDESKGTTDMAAAIPLKEAMTVPGAISQSFSDGKAVQVDYYGDYDKAEVAHDAIADYLQDNGLLVNYPIVQEYLTDPTVETDPTRWQTKITYYITNSTQ